MEVEGRGGTRACGRDHLDMGCDTISRWLKTRVRHVRPVAGLTGVFSPAAIVAELRIELSSFNYTYHIMRLLLPLSFIAARSIKALGCEKNWATLDGGPKRLQCVVRSIETIEVVIETAIGKVLQDL